MKTKFFPKEKAQSLVEYALILVLLAIVIMSAAYAFLPHYENIINAGNKGVLSDAPIILDYGSPVYLPEGSYFTRYIMVDHGSCEDINSGPYDIKAGTTYEDPSVINLFHADEYYRVCNFLRGTSVQVIYALYIE